MTKEPMIRAVLIALSFLAGAAGATAQEPTPLVEQAVGVYLSPEGEYFIEIRRCRPREAEFFCGQREGMPTDNLLCARVPLTGLSDKTAHPEDGVGPAATEFDRTFLFNATNGYVGCFAPAAPSTVEGGEVCRRAEFEGVGFSWEAHAQLGIGDGSMFAWLDEDQLVFFGCPGARDWSDGGRYTGAYGACDVGDYGADACERAVLTRASRR